MMASDKVTSVPQRRSYEVVIAATRDMGVGINGDLPFHIPTDQKFFHDITTATSDPTKTNAVIMGRKSWESTPSDIRPLPGRLNVILTRSGSFFVPTSENVIICDSMDSALELLATSPYSAFIEKVFNIGGGEILRDTMNAPGCDAIHLTEVDISVECDAFAPPVDRSLYRPWYSSFPIVENGTRYSFVTYVRARDTVAESSGQKTGVASNINGPVESAEKKFSFLPKMIFKRHEEFVYLDLVRDVIYDGDLKDGMKGTDVLSKFGCQMRFNLRKTFPLLTTKSYQRVSWNSVVQGLLGGINGSTNGEVLLKKGGQPGDGNLSIPSFRRHPSIRAHCTGQGFDKLLDVISKIKNNPTDRRITLSARNISDLNSLATPPAHMFAQFYVAQGELSCQIYTCSADMVHSVPFDIAFYSLLTCMVAHVCGLHPGDLIIVIGEARVDLMHVRRLEEQLQQLPEPFPILKINPEKKDIDSFVESDFELVGYKFGRE